MGLSVLSPIQGTFPRNPKQAASLLGLTLDVKRDYGASGSSASTTGSMTSGSKTLTLTAAEDFQNGQGISVAGAGASGALLVTTIDSGAGTTTLTLTDAATTTVSDAEVWHDDTSAIQAAITAVENAGGGIVYLPGGFYPVSSEMSHTADCSVTIRGVGRHASGSQQPQITGGTAIMWNGNPNPYTILSATSGRFYVEDLGIHPYYGPGDSGGGYVSVSTSADGGMRRVTITGGPGVGFSTTAVQVSSGYWVIEDCNLNTWTYGVVCTGGGQLCTIKDTVLGGGVTGAGGAGVLIEDGFQTVRIRGSQTQGGDHGLIMQSGSGSAPGFLFIDDFEINSPAVSGMDLTHGSQVWANELWVSGSGLASTVAASGIVVGSSFTGDVVLVNSVIQGFPQYGMTIAGGAGYGLVGCQIGGNGGYATNTYDDLYVDAAVTALNVVGCQFNVAPYLTSTDTRSGVHLGAFTIGKYAVSANVFGTGYQTGPIMNDSTTGTGALIAANSGYTPGAQTAPAVPSSGTALTNPFPFAATVYVAGGTVTAIDVGGTATGMTSGPVRVAAGQTITLTYSVAPTWTWFGE